MEWFVVFALASQLLMLGFFAARRWRPDLAGPLGRAVYGLGLPAVLLAVVFWASGQPANLVLAFAAYAAWSALGAFVDIVHPIAWRRPARWSVLVPYAVLLISAMMLLWVPLWWVSWWLWLLYGVLYAAHTTLNLTSHGGRDVTPRRGHG
jgi:hypothetical protein